MTTSPNSMFRKALPYLVAVSIIIIAFLINRGLVASKPQAPERPVEERVWSVNTLAAELAPIAPTVTLYGRIESPRSSEMTAAVTAFVTDLYIDEGDRARKDDILLSLDPRDAMLVVDQRSAELSNISAQINAEKTRYQSDLNALKIQQRLLQLTAKSVDRFKTLEGRKVSSASQLEDAQRSYQLQALALNNRQREINDHPNRLAQLNAQLSQAETKLKTAQLDLERTKITAPFNGRIAKVSVAPGDRVRSGDSLLVIYNNDDLEVRAQIPSRYLSRIRQSLAAKTILTANTELDGQSLNLQLHRLSGEVGSGRAGVDALLRFNSNTDNLELGRSIQLDLKLPAVNDVLALPPQSLYGTNRIYRVTNSRLEAVQIERIGEKSTSNATVILVKSSVIKAGDNIVTTQLPNAITGLKVKVITPQQP